MSGLRHIFVAGLRANKDVESVLANGRFQPLHMDQADHDWCGPWSLMQAAVLLCGWNRRVVATPRADREPWRSFWRRVKADYDHGTDEADLSTLAALLAPWIQVQVTKTISPRRIAALVESAIVNGDVPLLRSTTARWSHWSMIAGISIGADGAPTALLLLDTSVDAPWAVPYNAYQELHPSKPAGTEFRYEGRTLDGVRWRARFNSVMIVRRGDAPEVQS
jgi:hypothetical protein